MSLQFAKLYLHSSKDHYKGHPPIPRDPSEWPREWHTVYYKEYPRFPRIELPIVNTPSRDYFDVVSKRTSTRNFKRASLSLNELSSLLKYACGVTSREATLEHRAHASGGGRFPVEVYLLVFRGGKDVPAGVYHYNVRLHVLEEIDKRVFTDEEIDTFFTYEWVKTGSIGVVMTGVLWRTMNKYGERGLRYVLLEAGHIGQNMYLAASALGIGCCTLGGTYDSEIEDLLELDSEMESVVYGAVIGK